MRLEGLDGRNPLGFLAALGALKTTESGTLAWSRGSRACGEMEETGESRAFCKKAARECVRTGKDRALDVDWMEVEKAESLRFEGEALRRYLDGAGEEGEIYVGERIDGEPGARRSSWCFDAGQQRFARMAREVCDVTREDIEKAVFQRWKYAVRTQISKKGVPLRNRELSTMMWDPMDDRDGALLGFDPSLRSEKKETCPVGADALGILGMSFYPVLPGGSDTAAWGFSNRRTEEWFSWPLWERALRADAVRSVLAGIAWSANRDDLNRRRECFAGFGVFAVMRVRIRRQGKLKKFAPPEVVWER